MVDRVRLGRAGDRPAWLTPPAMLLGAGIAAAVLLAALAGLAPQYDRHLFATLLVVNLALAAAVRPRLAVALTFGFLVLLGAVRRMFIPASGWSAFDPLLLVAPAASVVLLTRALLEGRLRAPDLLSRLVACLLGLTVLEVFNPAGGGIVANATGLLFLAAPLLWFFVGMAYGGRGLPARLLPGVVVLAIPVAIYGLAQTFLGLPGWDQAWVDTTGYAALHVGEVVRAFGSFASAAEYAVFLAVAIVVVGGWTTLRRAAFLLALPLLGAAIFLESSRGILVLCAFAILCTAALRTGSGRRALVAIALGLAVVLSAGRLVTPQDTTTAGAAGASQDPTQALVQHQVGGLTDPLNPDQSTLLLHWSMVVNGLADSFQQPLGRGPAASNLASARLGQEESNTEVDVVNEMTALGTLGGLLLVAVIVVTLKRAVQVALRSRDTVYLACAGLLLVTLGQWLNGGFYAVSPLVWVVAGSVNIAWLAQRAERRARGLRVVEEQP